MISIGKFDPMLARVLICLCSLAVILCVPVKKTIPGRRIEPASARLLPHIDLPYSIVKKTKYELRGECMTYLNALVLFLNA